MDDGLRFDARPCNDQPVLSKGGNIFYLNEHHSSHADGPRTILNGAIFFEFTELNATGVTS